MSTLSLSMQALTPAPAVFYITHVVGALLVLCAFNIYPLSYSSQTFPFPHFFSFVHFAVCRVRSLSLVAPIFFHELTPLAWRSSPTLTKLIGRATPCVVTGLAE